MTRVDELWDAIAATTDRTSVFRRVDETHPLSLYAGIDHDGRRVLMLVTSKCRRNSHPLASCTWSAINERTGSSRSSFSSVVPSSTKSSDACVRTSSTQQGPQYPTLGAEAVLRRLGRWRKLLEVGQRTTLSDIALRGLIGELWFLQHVALRRLGADAAVQGWVGPLDAPQDFIVGEEVFEIKTCAPQHHTSPSHP